MPWLSKIKSSEEVNLMGQVFEDIDIQSLANVLTNNANLRHLDISYTNFTDDWFNTLTMELLKKTDEQLGKLTIDLDNALISDSSLGLLKKLKLKLHKLNFTRSEFFSPEGLAELSKASSASKGYDLKDDKNHKQNASIDNSPLDNLGKLHSGPVSLWSRGLWSNGKKLDPNNLTKPNLPLNSVRY